MKALVLRPGHAVGDAIWISPIPRLLAEAGYEVTLGVEEHNKEVFRNNPHVAHYLPIPPSNAWRQWYADEYPGIVTGYDRVVKASGHVEVKMLFRTDAAWGAIPSGPERRELAKGVSYQDRIFQELGVSDEAALPEFYFSPDEEERIQRNLNLKAERKEKLILWQWEGSSKSKEMVFGPHYLREVLKQVPNSVHYVFSQSAHMQYQIPHDDPRVHNITGKSGIRNSIMLARVADLVIGPESLWVNAAAGFDTPKIIFFSHSAPENLAKRFKNCFAVTPDIACHPCYLIAVDFRTVFQPERRAIAREYERHCQTYNNQNIYQVTGYKCCVNLPHLEVIKTIVKILRHGPKAAAKKGIKAKEN